jgi:plasmid stability protein
MADLLVRNIPDDVKQRLAVRAAENGRSQSAEALAILEESLKPATKTWFEMLYETAQEVGGFELEPLERHPAREFSFEE